METKFFKKIFFNFFIYYSRKGSVRSDELFDDFAKKNATNEFENSTKSGNMCVLKSSARNFNQREQRIRWTFKKWNYCLRAFTRKRWIEKENLASSRGDYPERMMIQDLCPTNPRS